MPAEDDHPEKYGECSNILSLVLTSRLSNDIAQIIYIDFNFIANIRKQTMVTPL